MTRLKKFAYIIISASLIVAIFPSLMPSNVEHRTADASAEILFKKNVNASMYGISRQYITWLEYKDNAYNIYVYNFSDKSETKVNKQALSVDSVGPYLYQRYIYWIDHIVDGWTISKYDILTGETRILRKTNTRIDTLAIADAYIAYVTRSNDTNYNQLFLIDLSDFSERALTDGKTWIGEATVFGKNVVWTQFPTIAIFQGDNPKGDIMRHEIESSYTSLLIGSLDRPYSVDVLGTTLAFTSRVSGHEVISIYYLNTGTRYQLTSSDYNVYFPSLAENMITYVKAGTDNKRISYFKFGENKYIDLTSGSSNTGNPVVSFDGKLIIWSDDHLGTKDLYYYDFDADASAFDQDNDGLSDNEEIKLGTVQYDADIDKDGLTDGQEVNRYHTNLTKWDTDGDGLSDGDEVLHWMTDPLKTDSNSNGLSDVQDLKTGFNPTVSVQEFTKYQGVMRGPSLSEEYNKSKELSNGLNNLLGKNRWRVTNKAMWFKMINAYIYGGYTLEEVASYLKGNKYALSDTTPAEYWRSYQASIGHSTTTYISSGKNTPVKKTTTPKRYQAKKSIPDNLSKVYSSAEVTPSSVKNVYKTTYYLLP